MKRADFVKSVLSLTGTAFIYGCKDAGDIIDPVSGANLTLEESEDWFTKTYLPRFQNQAGRVTADRIERDFDWNKGMKVKNKKDEFVWVPAKYKKSNEFPSLVSWKDGEEHIPKLAEFLKWDIAEGFVVYKGKKDLEGFLVQVAYDPFKHKMGEKIDRDHFTGMIIHADINENPLRAWRYLDGKLDISFDSEANKGARTQQCITTYYSYQTVTGQSCGPNCSEITVTLHQGTQTICDGGGYPYGSGAVEGYPYYPGGGGGGGGSNGTSTPTYSYTTPYVDYDFNMIARHEGIDYQTFMQKLSRTLDVLGIAGISFGIPTSYADAALKGIGIKDAVIQGTYTIEKLSTKIGLVGFYTGAASVVIGFTDGEITQSDIINFGSVVITGYVVFGNPVGWVGLTLSGVSALMAIYATGHQ